MWCFEFPSIDIRSLPRCASCTQGRGLHQGWAFGLVTCSSKDMLGHNRLLGDRADLSGRCHPASCPFQPFTVRRRLPPRLQQLQLRAQTENSSNGEQEKKPSGGSQEANKDKNNALRAQRNRKGKNKYRKLEDASLKADDFNPIALGRRSR